ncbi:MAG: Ig-like domain-containing protein [Nibricoccus sp.]
MSLTLNTGGTVSASYVSGSGGTDLVFRYTVATGNFDADGVSIGSAVIANGGTLRDPSGNNAALTLNNVASTTGVKVDAVSPQLTSILRKTPATQFNSSSTVVYEVTFSEAVQNLTPNMFAATAVNGSTVVGSVTSLSGGPSVYDVTVTVASGTGDFRLDIISDTSSQLGANSPATNYLTGYSVQTLAIDSADALYVPDYNVIYKAIAPETATNYAWVNGYFTASALDSAGNLYLVDQWSYEVIKVEPNGSSYTYAYGFNYPQDVVCDASGNLYVTDMYDNDVKIVSPGGSVSTFAYGFNSPAGIAIDSDGNLFVSNTGDYSVSKVTPAGVVSTFASNVGYGYGLTCDAAGNVYMADNDTRTVIRISADGSTVTTISGSGLSNPYDVAIDSTGRLYVTDTNMGAVLLIDLAKLKDTAGNLLTGLPYTSGQLYTQTTNPFVTGVSSSSANTNYKIGDVVNIEVSFSASVTVNTTGGTPTILLETGTTDRTASYVSGSGSATLTFNYTVQSGDLSADLDYASTAALSLNGGTIKGTTGSLDALLTLPDIGNAQSLAAQKAIVVNGVRPTASIVVSDSALSVGETSLVTITFSQAVTGFTNADLSVVNGTLTTVATSDSITWTASFTPAAGVEDSSNAITLASTGVTNAAGNTGTGTTDSNNFAIDTLPPSAPGAFAAVASTNTISLNWTNPTAGDFASITIRRSTTGYPTSVADGTAVASNVTSTTFQQTGLADGTYYYSAFARDNSGNTSSAAHTTATVDTIPPVAPSAPDLATASDSGSSNTDNITNVTTPTFTGTAEADSTIELFRGGSTSLGTTTANSSGIWSLTLGTALAQGTYSITAKATDAAGNTGVASNALSVTIDTTASSAPALAAITNDTGTSNTDRITSDTTLILSGTGAANETVTVFRNTVQIGTAATNVSGIWSFDYTSTTLAAGTHPSPRTPPTSLATSAPSPPPSS